MTYIRRAATLAVLIALWCTSAASAGMATVHQCRGPQGAADTDLIQVDGDTPIAALVATQCPAGPAAIVSTGQQGANGGEANKTLRFVAPPSTTIVGGTLSRQMSQYLYAHVDNGDVDSYGFGYELTDGNGTILERCGHNGALSPGNCGPAFSNWTSNDRTTFPSSTYQLPTAPMAEYRLTVGCVVANRCRHHFDNPGLNTISAALRIRDDSAPTDVEVLGPLTTADPIKAGDREIDLTASDTGLGVFEAEFLVDGAVVDRATFSTNDGACVDANPTNGDRFEWRSGHPCPLDSPTKTFIPSNLPEGAHNLKVRVVDAAGNAVIALNRNVTIDLVERPTMTRAPSVTGNAQEGRTLVGDPGAWDAHGAAQPSFAYQWQRCAADAGGCTDIGEATAALYDVRAADVGSRLRVRVRATNPEGTTEAFSGFTPVIVAKNTQGDPVLTAPGARPEPAAGTPNGEHATSLAVLSSERRSVRVPFGRPVTITGRLLTPAGTPITGAKLEVGARDAVTSAGPVRLPDAVTDGSGMFRYTVAPGASRTVTIGYRARFGDTDLARTLDVDVRVVAKVGFRLSRRALRNGQTLKYLGRIQGPRTGHRFVEVQVRNGKRWQIVCSVRTDARGAFACAHRFRRTFVRTTYVFRARVRRQAGLPYEPAVSRVRKARVRP